MKNSYNKIKKNNDKNSLEKTIEYAEQLKEWHFEGVLELVEGVKNLDNIISICKEQLEKLDAKRKEEERNPLLDKETLFFGGLFIIAIISIIYHYHNKNKTEKEKSKET